MDLYGLAPEEFTRVRDEQVKAARAAKDRERARELAALRRPTASAYAVNALVRQEPALLDQLLELGRALAQAQGGHDGGQLRELGEQRRALVEAVADRAAAATGRPLGPGPRAEVVATLEAALADPASGEAVRSGRLVRSLSYAGFGGVDLAGAVAETTVAPAPAGRDVPRRQEELERKARLAQARQAALDASGALDDAVRAATAAESDRAAREQAAGRAARQVADAERQLTAAREERDEADAALRRTARDLERAHDAVRSAQTAAERARAAVERLSGD